MTTPHALATSAGSAESPPTFDGGLTAGDVERIATVINAELSAATRAAYASSWRNWEAWCRARGVLPLPAAPEALAAYLAERADSGICSGTLDGACSAIAQRHHQDGLSDPTADPLVARVRRSLRRIMGTAPRRQAHPLTVAELARVVASIDTETPIGIRDRSVLPAGIRGRAAPQRARRARTRRHHRRPARPAHLHPPVEDRPGRARPARRRRRRPALHDRPGPRPPHLARHPARRAGAAAHTVPAARAISREGIGPRTVSDLVRNRAHAAGLGDLGVSGHSLRAGHATTAALNGAPIDRIAAQTRHRDLGTLRITTSGPPTRSRTPPAATLGCDAPETAGNREQGDVRLGAHLLGRVPGSAVA